MEDQTFEVNYNENLTSEPDKLENEFKLEELNLNEIVDYAVDWASNPIVSTLETKFANPSSEFLPSLELKALPEHLKYAYLGKNDTFPIIIASHLIRE